MSQNHDTRPRDGSDMADDEGPRAARDFFRDLQRFRRGEDFGEISGDHCEPFRPGESNGLAVHERLGPYEVLRRIASGGMGTVYEGRDGILGRRVALKVIRISQGTPVRFEREARVLAKLKHPAIVELYEFGEDDGLPFIAMEYLEGEDLGKVLERRLTGTVEAAGSTEALRKDAASRQLDESAGAGSLGGREDAEHPRTLGLDAEWARTVLIWMRDVARGLEHGHSLGVLHRDIKPSNLFATSEGQIKIMDFGLARDLKDAAVTRTGDFLGTLRYMSPEQLLGKRASIDQRTDVYSLGVTLYELLCGEYPYPHDSQQELYRKIALEEPRPLRERAPWVSRDLETVVTVAMAKHPGHRYQTAGALADDLDAIMDGRPIRARPPGPARRLRLHVKRNQRLYVSLSLGLLLAMMLAGVWAYLRDTGAGVQDSTVSWEEAIASIADPDKSPHYHGLEIQGQAGLVPIGQDPQSGLWEFAHLGTGEPPRRNADGKLRLTPESGVILVLIPGGKALMGAQSTAPREAHYSSEASGHEGPVREVTVSPFFISKYELRQTEYYRVLAENPSYFQGSNLPVEQVSWTDAQRFCSKAGLRLPSQAQWEYACRAGADSAIAGTGKLAEMGWYVKNANHETKQVGEKLANAFGLYDVHGNVWEWCEEWLAWECQAKSEAEKMQLAATDSTLRLLRGGSCLSDEWFCRSSCRAGAYPESRSKCVGLRPARPLRGNGKNGVDGHQQRDCTAAPINLIVTQKAVAESRHETREVDYGLLGDVDDKADISVKAPSGTHAEVTLYVAIVSNGLESGVQGWSLSGRVTGDFLVAAVTTEGTAVAVARDPDSRLKGVGFETSHTISVLNPASRPEKVHPDTGKPQGEGFVSAVVLSIGEMSGPSLEPTGTATVLAVTLRTARVVEEGETLTGVLEWPDNMVGPGLPVQNVVTIRRQSRAFCTAQGAIITATAIGKSLDSPAAESVVDSGLGPAAPPCPVEARSSDSGL